MSLLNDILKQIQGGIAQVNPMDGGQDYRSVTRPQAPVQRQAGQATRMQLNGAITEPGVRVAEDDFTFPNGGQFTRLPNGQAYINGGFAEPNAPLQEDSFSFNNRLPNEGAVTGAVDSLWQQRKGFTPYGVGAEGPRTRY